MSYLFCCLSGESRLAPLGFKTGRESFPSSGSSTMQCLSCILRFVYSMRSLITPLSQLNHQFPQLLPMNLMTFIPNRSGWFITFFYRYSPLYLSHRRASVSLSEALPWAFASEAILLLQNMRLATCSVS